MVTTLHLRTLSIETSHTSFPLLLLSEVKPDFLSFIDPKDIPQFEGQALDLFRLITQLPVVRIMQLPVQLAAVCRLLEQESNGYKLAMYALNMVREVGCDTTTGDYAGYVI